MTEVVNLNRARKARAAEKAAQVASVNRVAFGRSRAEKQLAKALAAQAKARLDQVRRDDT